MGSESTLRDLVGVPLVPQWTGKRDYRIGFIGVGGIATFAHLPSYRKAGFNVVAAADIRAERREQAQREWGIEATYSDYRQMIEAERPDIVDVTVSWEESRTKVESVQAAAQAGVHVLIQKPFAAEYHQCTAMVEAAKTGGIKLAVNQNARWSPVFYAARQLLIAGAIGKLQTANLEFRFPIGPGAVLMDFCNHEYDLVRAWFGREPEKVFAALSGEEGKGKFEEGEEKFISTLLEFSKGCHAAVWDDVTPPYSECWRFRLAGTEGILRGNEGLVTFFPSVEEPTWIELIRRDQPGMIFRPRLTDHYIPEAFICTMSDLMEAIEQDREPLTSGADNLGTMAIVFAARQSVREKKAINPATIC